jgi:glutathione S-transferase
MLTLSGFSASNYYNKVKLALLEKGVPFEEELAWVGATDAAASPSPSVTIVVRSLEETNSIH